MNENTENVTDEKVEETISEESEVQADITSIDAKTIRDLQSMIAAAEESLESIKEMTLPIVEEHHLDFDQTVSKVTSILRDIDSGRRDKNLNGTEDSYTISYSENEDEYFKSTREEIVGIMGPEFLPEGEEFSPEKIAEANDVIGEVAGYSVMLIAFEGIQAEFNKAVKAQYDYLNSPQYAEAQAQRLKKLEEQAARETDPARKAQMERVLANMHSLNTLEYIFTRFNREGAKEVKSIKDAFFDTRRSEVVMERFSRKGKRMNINQNLVLTGMSIETRFLDRKYWPFNNLFLFGLIRSIGYSDPYENTQVMYARNTLRSIIRLIEHKFAKPEDEKTFLSIIETYDDYFMEFRDEFVEKNPSYHAYLKTQKDVLMEDIRTMDDEDKKNEFNAKLEAIDIENVTVDVDTAFLSLVDEVKAYIASLPPKTQSLEEVSEDKPVEDIPDRVEESSETIEDEAIAVDESADE